MKIAYFASVPARQIVILLLVLLAACSPNSPKGSSTEGDITPVAAPSEPPETIVERFLTGWNALDYETMYSLVSPQSRELYAFEVFSSRYEVAHKDMNFGGVRFDIDNTLIQGTTAVVTYDVEIDSPYFGTIVDPGREMRLVQTPQGWQIAWTTMDIFEGLAAGGRITVDSRFPDRANIYDRNGNVLVQQNGTIVTLYTSKQNMRGVDDCIDLMADILFRQRRDVVKQFSNYLDETRFFLGEMDINTYTQNRSALENTCGVDIADQRQGRMYYGQGAIAHVTGYIGLVPADQQNYWEGRGYRVGDIVGLSNVENAYQDQLAGKAQRILRITEPGGITLRELAESQPEAPSPVTLTIDRDLQMTVAQAVNDAYNYAEDNWGGVSFGAAAVVMDVNTGEILALVSYPSFDPTIFNPDSPQPDGNLIADLSEDVRQPFTNRVTQQQYFPGSVFKIVTTTAAASEGLMGPDDLFDCQLDWYGGDKYGDVLTSRPDWRKTDGFDPAGEITMSQALTSSCDPFFYEMGARLYLERSPNTLVEYGQLLGLGQRIGLPLQETSGDLAPPRTVGNAINNAIGQGDVRLPPIQVAQMVAAIANGGTLHKAYLVEKVGGEDGAPLTYEAETSVKDLGLSQEAIDVVQQGMCAVTTDENLGTAQFVFEGAPYWACGKTGTAQTSLYPNAWFVAYAPKEDPEIAIVVMAENSREGSEVAAPIVRRILDTYFNAPVEPYPKWWSEGPYVPLEIPEGATGGG